MRASIAHLLIALLIAVFAIGAPLPALADCARCDDCTAAAPTGSDAPCPHKGITCQMLQNCAGQLHKMPAQSAVQSSPESSRAAFGQRSRAAIKLAQITPETAPPRA